MNISILSIATGKYIDFIPDLIKSSEENFLKNHKKTYYIFTDKKSSIRIKGINIVKVYQEKLGWPYDTMMRFHMFLSLKDKIEKSDFTFFLNANMEFKEEIGEEVFPDLKNEFLVGVKHPGFFKLDKSYMPYERRKESNFCIADSDNLNNMYYQGCFNGGESKKWIEMCEILSLKIDEDLNSNIIPIWHDESALNWYFRNIKIKSLEPEYAMPEQIIEENFSPSSLGNIHCYSDLKNSKPFIIQRDKRKYGGSDFLRS